MDLHPNTYSLRCSGLKLGHITLQEGQGRKIFTHFVKNALRMPVLDDKDKLGMIPALEEFHSLAGEKETFHKKM